MWTIHNFPTYELVARCVHHGYKTCPTCGLGLTVRHSLELGKVVYEGSCQWLVRGHPYKRNRNPTHFSGKENHRSRLEPIITSATLKSAIKYEKWLGTGNTTSSKGDPSKFSGIKWRNALYDLPYFEICIA